MKSARITQFTSAKRKVWTIRLSYCSIAIDDALLQDKEMLEDYLILTLNKAIEKATNVNEAELAAVAKEGLPNIPGLDMFK